MPKQKFKLILRLDGRVEMQCKHSIGHTVYATASYKKKLRGYWKTHGCDGCCTEAQAAFKKLMANEEYRG